jgi:hypothetical protein
VVLGVLEVCWNIAQDETPGESSSRNHIRTVYYAQLREGINAASGLWCTTASASAAIDIERESAIEAPLIAYRDAAPTGFSREVMYVNDGRDDSDRDAMRFLMKVREGAAGGPINVLALSGGGGGVAFDQRFHAKFLERPLQPHARHRRSIGIARPP